MATSGYTDVAVTNNNTLRFYWSLNSQSVASNYSDISWVMQLISDAYGTINSTASKAWSVNVDGQSYSGTNTVGIVPNTTKTLASGTKTIYHNTDGSKSFSYSFSQQFNITFSSGYVTTVTGSGSGTLPTIARASQPSVSASSVTMGNSITIYTNRASSSFTHNIYYNWQNNNYTTGLSATSGISDSLTFTPPKSLANNIPNNQSSTCTIYCDTYNGGTYIGTKSCTVTISISSDIKPTVSAVVTDANGYATIFGGYVVGKSKYTVQLTEAGSYSSSIASRTITMNGATYTANPSTSNVLLAVGNNSAVCQVRDSRGVYSDALTKTMTVLDYSVPAINSFSVSRCNSDGTSNDEGEYAKVTYNVSIIALNNHNTKSLVLKYKKVADASYTQQTITMTSYSQSSSLIISSISGLYSYDFLLEANDYFNVPTQKSQVLSTAATLIDFKGDDAIAFGKIAEHDNLFECELPAQFNNGITGNLLPAAIPASSNLNTYTTPGMYYCAASATAQTLTNSPTTISFSLEVVKHNGVAQIVTEYIAASPARMYFRNVYSSTWSAWKQILIANRGTASSRGSVGNNLDLADVQGAGINLKDESTGTIWHLHSHGDRVRLYNGSTELTFLVGGDNHDHNAYASGVGISYGGSLGSNFYSSGGGAAGVTFHRPGAYAVNFGLDTDNQLKVGGYSMGGNSYTIYHSGNSHYHNYADIGSGGACVNILGQNVHANRTTGFYMGDQMTNAPNSNWHYYHYMKHNDSYCVVVAYPLNYAGYVYWKRNTGGSWTGWMRIDA